MKKNTVNNLLERVYLCRETYVFSLGVFGTPKYWFETYLIYYRTKIWIHIINLDTENNYIRIANIVN